MNIEEFRGMVEAVAALNEFGEELRMIVEYQQNLEFGPENMLKQLQRFQMSVKQTEEIMDAGVEAVTHLNQLTDRLVQEGLEDAR